MADRTTVKVTLEVTVDELEWVGALTRIDPALRRLRPQVQAAVEALDDERVWVPTVAGLAALGGAA